MTKRTAVVSLALFGFVLLAAFTLLRTPEPENLVSTDLGFSELPDGRGGINVESIAYTEEMGFDKRRSREAFENTLCPLLRGNCSGCHVDGMNRINNDLRDWLDEDNRRRLPKGEFGVDGWIEDAATVERVRELYPPSSEMRKQIENDRRIFLTAMAKIKDEMILGADKNVYVEPAIWTIEWARDLYRYPVTRSN